MDQPLSGALRVVEVDRLRPNTWNPNELSESDFEKVVRSIRKHGFVVPLVVYRPQPKKKLVIINGEHRWKAAKKLGMPHVPVVVLKTTTRSARELCLNLNYLHGDPDPARTGEMVKWFEEHGLPLPKQAERLSFSQTELEEFFAETQAEADRQADELEEETKERTRAVRSASHDRIHEVQLGPFTREERDEVVEILADEALLSRYDEAELLLALLRTGRKVLTRKLSQEADDGQRNSSK